MRMDFFYQVGQSNTNPERFLNMEITTPVSIPRKKDFIGSNTKVDMMSKMAAEHFEGVCLLLLFNSTDLLNVGYGHGMAEGG